MCRYPRVCVCVCACVCVCVCLCVRVCACVLYALVVLAVEPKRPPVLSLARQQGAAPVGARYAGLDARAHVRRFPSHVVAVDEALEMHSP